MDPENEKKEEKPIEFNYNSRELSSNKSMLIDGFNLLKNFVNIDENFETVEDFLSYVNSFVQDNRGSSNTKEICDFFYDNQFYDQLLRLRKYFAAISSELKCHDTNEEEGRKFEIFKFSLRIENFLLIYSVKIRMKYLEIGAVKNLLKLLSNKTFVQNFKDESCFKTILVNIGSLSKDANLYKIEWTKLGVIDVLLDIAQMKISFKQSCYGTVSRIANDSQLNELGEKLEIISIFAKSLEKAATEISEEETLQRENIDFSDDENEGKPKQYEVYFVESNYTGLDSFALTYVLEILYKLAVNDKLKYDLYVKHNVKDPLRIIIFKGSDIEKRFAFRLLAQLCFDPLVLEMVSRDLELKNLIEKLSTDTSGTSKKVSKISKGIKFGIETHNKNETVVKNKNEQKQIMISYNSGSRELCMKIKEELTKSCGYKVWIDVDEIHGSSLDSMAKAVETSDLILMCVTEDYRQSINCQSEAQYAFKLKKPIMPLIMQKGYENVGGWLGLIMSDKIYINYTKYSFVESTRKLFKQVAKVIGNNKADFKDSDSIKTLKSLPQTPVPVKIKQENEKVEKSDNNVQKWSEDEVEKWFKESGSMIIYEKLRPCNGELLNQLYELKVNAPEFFYKFVTSDNKLDCRSILVFGNNLNKLFSS